MSQRMRDYWESAATYDAAQDGPPDVVEPDVVDCRTAWDRGEAGRSPKCWTFTAEGHRPWTDVTPSPACHPAGANFVFDGPPDEHLTRQVMAPVGSIWTDSSTGEMYQLVSGVDWAAIKADSITEHDGWDGEPQQPRLASDCAHWKKSAQQPYRRISGECFHHGHTTYCFADDDFCRDDCDTWTPRPAEPPQREPADGWRRTRYGALQRGALYRVQGHTLEAFPDGHWAIMHEGQRLAEGYAAELTTAQLAAEDAMAGLQEKQAQAGIGARLSMKRVRTNLCASCAVNECSGGLDSVECDDFQELDI